MSHPARQEAFGFRGSSVPKTQAQKQREIAEKRQVKDLNRSSLCSTPSVVTAVSCRIFETRSGWDEDWSNVVPILELRTALGRIGYPCDTGDENEVESRPH